MTQQYTGFSTKEPTIATLQHWIGEKGENGDIKVDLLVLHKVLSRIVEQNDVIPLASLLLTSNIFHTSE